MGTSGSKAKKNLSRKEAIKLVQSELGVSEDRAESMVDTVDKNHDGQLKGSEMTELWDSLKNTRDTVRPKFLAHDRFKSGYVEVDDGVKVLMEVFNTMSKKQAKVMVENYEVNGRMNYEDFIYFYCNVKSRSDELRDQFAGLQEDNMGTINVSHIHNLMQRECALDDHMINYFTDDMDLNQDGKINKSTFMKHWCQIFQIPEPTNNRNAKQSYGAPKGSESYTNVQRAGAPKRAESYTNVQRGGPQRVNDGNANIQRSYGQNVQSNPYKNQGSQRWDNVSMRRKSESGTVQAYRGGNISDNDDYGYSKDKRNPQNDRIEQKRTKNTKNSPTYRSGNKTDGEEYRRNRSKSRNKRNAKTEDDSDKEQALRQKSKSKSTSRKKTEKPLKRSQSYKTKASKSIKNKLRSGSSDSSSEDDDDTSSSFSILPSFGSSDSDDSSSDAEIARNRSKKTTSKKLQNKPLKASKSKTNKSSSKKNKRKGEIDSSDDEKAAGYQKKSTNKNKSSSRNKSPNAYKSKKKKVPTANLR